MKKTLIVPVLLLATTPFVVSCTKKPTDLPPPPPVTGTTETVAPTVVPVVTPSAPTTSTTATTPAVPVTVTRTEILTYATPAGPKDPIEFSVTVTDGTITAASATSKSTNDISKQLQTAFAGEVSSKVVGKKAKDLKVDAIGGASLTTAAFETFVHGF